MKILVTLPYRIGGVFSFNALLAQFGQFPEGIECRFLLLRNTFEDKQAPPIEEIRQFAEVEIFVYSSQKSLYHEYCRLAGVLQRYDIIVTDNEPTLQALASLIEPKRCVLLIHDIFYVNLALKWRGLLTLCIAHSRFFLDILIAQSYLDFHGKTKFIPYGVSPVRSKPRVHRIPLKCCFLGRLTESKGVRRLFEIEKELVKRGIVVEWTIIGQGPERERLRDQWKGHERVSFLEPKNRIEIYERLKSQHVLVFPSYFEGTPVAILEAMSFGVVPVANHIPGGVSDTITPDRGYLIRENRPNEYAQSIAKLVDNPRIWENQSVNCMRFMSHEGNAVVNFPKYAEAILSAAHFPIPDTTAVEMVLPSRLDRWKWPSNLVEILRKIKGRCS